MIAATPLIAALAAMQAVEQIPPPAPPAQTGPARTIPSDATRVAQLPSDARAVDQPQPAATPDHKADPAADDAARAYAKILGTGPTTPRGSAVDLSVRTLAEAAAAANLAVTPPPTPAPHGTPRS